MLEFYYLATSKIISERARDMILDVYTHGDFIVQLYWEIRLLAPNPIIPLSHLILTLN